MDLFVITAVVGFVEFCRRLHLKDYFAAITIAGAAIIGGLAGYFGLDGLTTVGLGVQAGLSASGLVTVASKVNTAVTTKYQR